MSYSFNREFALAANEGSSQKAQNLYVIAHETANPTATGRNEATFMKRNWRNAYTQFIIGDGGIIYLIGEPGYVAYGALSANPYSPVQIELQHTKDKTMFQKNYAAYIWLIRWACDKYNIPKTLDAGKAGTKGVKSHKWVSDNIEGDHQDPYSYLASMGISKSQFAKDIKNGVSTPSKNTYLSIKKPIIVKALQDVLVYNDKERKKLSSIVYKKGSVFFIDKEIAVPGSVKVGQPRSGGYCTLNDKWVAPRFKQ